MSASKPGQFGEEWDQYREDRRTVVDHEGELVAEFFKWRDGEPERAVACVNALDGLDPEAVPALIEAAKLAIENQGCGDPDCCQSAIAGDEAHKALRAALAAFGVKP